MSIARKNLIAILCIGAARRFCSAFLILAYFFFQSLLSISCKLPERLLEIDIPLQRTVSASEQDQYRFNFDPGRAIQVALTPLRGLVQGKVYDEQGVLLTELFGNEIGYTASVTLNKASGSYHIVITSLTATDLQATYEVKIQVSPDSPTDIPLRLEAEAALLRAEKNKLDGSAEKNYLAIEEYNKAKDALIKLNDLSALAEVTRKRGEVHLALGEVRLAENTYKEALNISEKLPNVNIKSSALSNLVSFYNDNLPEARKYAEMLWQLSQQTNDLKITAQAKAAKGEIESRINTQGAIDSLRESLKHWEEVGDLKRQIRVQLQIGRATFYNGGYRAASELYVKSRQLARSNKLYNEELASTLALGFSYSILGEKQTAIRYYEEARALARQIGNKQTEAGIIGGMAFIYEELGKKEAALPLRQECVKIFRSLNDYVHEATAQMLVGELYFSLGKDAIAEAHFQDVLNSTRERKDIQTQARLYRNLGRVRASAGKINEAIQLYEQALGLTTEIKDERWKAYVFSDIGQAYQKITRLAQAITSFQTALALNLKTGDKSGESQTRYFLAKAEQERGNYAEALTQIEAATNIIELLRGKVISSELRTSYFSIVNQIFAAHIDILMQRQTASQTEKIHETLTISERSRARTLLDLLNESRENIRQGVDPQLLEQQRSIQQILNGKADRKLTLANQPNKEAELAAVTEEVNNLTAQLDEVRSKIREASPRYAALTQPQPLKAAEIQQLLDDNTILLEYALGDERSYLWTVTRASVEVVTLPKRATIETLVREVLQLLTAELRQEGDDAATWQQRTAQAHQQYWLRAAALSQLVLGPIAEKLGNKRLVIVGDGVLQLLPFAALPKPSVLDAHLFGAKGQQQGLAQRPADNGEPLIVHHEITYLSSASSLKLLRENRVQPPLPNGWWARWRHSIQSWLGHKREPSAWRSVVVLADPVFEKDDKRVSNQDTSTAQSDPLQKREVELSEGIIYLPRLIETREEAAEIQKAAGAQPVLLKYGFEVNRALLANEELHPYGIVHFATHGRGDSKNPELSAIFLSQFDWQGNKIDGTLRLSDIYNLILPKELVVLSACETAVGQDVRGEGLIALTRGFMYAGASRVMASLWKIDDAATADIMKVFYQHLLQSNVSPATALRQAQIAMWQKAPSAVPYNWAAFVLQGEYR